MNLMHDLSAGSDIPNLINVIIEIPKGSRNKYEYSKSAGLFKLDRVLYSPFVYPADYGFVPQTHYDDGDPLDVLVLMNQPTFVGCVIEARPLGMLRMIDGGDADSKILAVPANDPYFNHYTSLDQVSPHYLREVEHFFQAYKTLQNKITETKGWAGLDETLADIVKSVAAYKVEFPESKVGVDL